MATELIYDRGRGPEIVGTRITVYNLLPHFLDPTTSEAQICEMYQLTPEQVAAARAYVLNHPDPVLAEHLRIEERLAIGNPPEVIEEAKRTRALMLRFKEWLTAREKPGPTSQPQSESSEKDVLPTFREWLAGRERP